MLIVKRVTVQFRLLATMLLLFATHSVLAASFDCAKAQTKVEKLICGDAELSKLDEELSAVYKTVLQDKQQADSIREKQKQWIKERNGCNDVGCVKRVYEARLSLIVAPKTPILHGEKPEQKTPVKIIQPRYGHCVDVGIAGSCGQGKFAKTGKGYAVCETYLKHLNSLEKAPKCEAPVPSDFKRPDWEDLDVLKHLRIAYQAEALYSAGWGGYKHPVFELWKQQLLNEMQAGKIAPQMRKTRVQPFGEKTITLLAYTRDRAACENDAYRQGSHWASNGYAYYLLLDDPESPLRVIDDRVSKAQSELLLYAGKPYFVLRSFYDPSIEIIAFDSAMTNAAGKAASIDAFYANVVPGSNKGSGTKKAFEPDPNVYWADQFCHFSPTKP